MAVNTQKFLPPSKSGTLSIRTSKISVSPRTSGKGGQLVGGGGSLSKEILQMKVKVLRLQGEIDRNIKFNKKEQDDKRKVDEKEKRSQREKQLEKKDGFKGVNLPNVIDKLPGGSIIDTIKRFLGFTFLGWLVNKYEILMPQLEKFMSLTKPVFEGLLFTTEAIAKGVFGFVESGYKAYDALSSTVKKIGGEDAEKTFTQFSTQLNGLLNGTFMLAMLVASTSPGGRTGGVPGGKPKGAVRTLKGYRAPEGMTRYLREDRIAQYGKRQKGFRDVLGQRGRIAQQRLISRPLRNATRPARQLASRVGGRVGGIAGKVPIVGPLIDFGIRTLVFKESPGRAAAGAVGLGVGQALGTWIGGAIGGVAGSVVPIIGNALAGAAGATIGSILGGLLGDFIGTSLYDFIAGMSNKQKPKGQARGGTVSQNRRPRRTSTTQVPTRRKIRPQETKPGKDVGGRKKIETFYGTDKPSGSIQTRGETIVKSLEKTSRDVKKLPLDWIASIGGAYIDMTMGQKPDKKLAADVGKSFGMFVETAINNEVAATTGQITKALVGMANGGSVPANSLERGQIGKSVARNIEERLQTIFDQSSTIALKNFKDQFSTLGGGAGFGEAPGDGGPSGPSGPVPDAYVSEDSKKAEADLLEYFSGLYGKPAAIGIVANLHRESGLRTVAPESGFNGMAQWDNTRWAKFKEWCKNTGKDPLSRSAQAQWVAIELNQSGTSRKLSNAKTPEEAASIFYNSFERGAFSRPVVGASNYDPNNEHEQKNRGFIKQVEKRNADFVKSQTGTSKLESDIMAFRRWRKENYGVSEQRIASNQTGILQVRELGSKGRGLLSTQINTLSDDLNFEFWEHSGAGHRENRAFDIPVSDLQMGDRVAQYFRAKGYNIIWKTSGHYNHVHVEVPTNKVEEFFKVVEKKPKPKPQAKPQAKIRSVFGTATTPAKGARTKSELIGGSSRNMQKGGILGPYSSLNSIKKDTSLSQEIVVMYQKEIVMVPSS